MSSNDKLPQKSAVKEIFGQFLTSDFWKSLAKELTAQVAQAILLALGRAIMNHANTKIQVQSTPQQPSVGERVWGNAPQSTPTYGGQSYPGTQYPVAVPKEPANPTFPGFK